MRSATISTGPSADFARKYRIGRSRLRASTMRSPSCAMRAKEPSISRTASISLASSLHRASDSSIPKRRWDPSPIRLMTREIGKCWFMPKNTSRFARMHHSRLFALFIAPLWFAGCTGRSDPPLFKLLSPSQTGITFTNTITTSDSLNVQTDVYVYNGAGVAVGDIDNDGLPDIFFAGNMVSSRLYLNKGAMRFEDITEKAGVTTKRWATGVTMVDINNDGYLDIYVSVSGPHWPRGKDRKTLLFINNRNR